VDRLAVYPGAIPLETDDLTPQRNIMIALGWALQGAMGTGTYVDGFTCVQTTVASQQVQVTPGQILSVQNVDNSAYSSLPADTVHQIVKQGLMLNTATFTCAAPLTSGQSINYLVEATYEDLDGTPVVLPYYNASNPSVAWSGPNNTGVAQNTVRQGLALVQVKTGVAATTGTQVTPTPDAGFVGMFVVTVAYGQTTITSTSIAAYTPTSFIPTKLPLVPAAVQNNGWTYGAAGGSSTAYTLATTPASTALVTGAGINVFFGTPNTTTSPTLNRDGLGAKPIVKVAGGAPAVGDITGWLAMIYDGTNWRIDGLVASDAVAASNAAKTFVVFNSTGSFTVPAGITNLHYRMWGGGGGSGGANSSGTTITGSPGGTGATYTEGVLAVTPGQVIAITVGASGTAGAATPTAGGNGGTSSLGAFATAPGGNGSNPASSGFPFPAAPGGTGASTGGAITTTGGPSSTGSQVGSTGIGGTGGGAYGQGACNLPASGAGAGIGGLFPGLGANGAGTLSTGSAAGGAGGKGQIILDF